MNDKRDRYARRRVVEEIHVNSVMGANARLIRLHVDYLRRTGATDTTQYHRRENLRRLAEALPCGLAEATPEILDDWQSFVSRRVSISSVATYTSHARSFFHWAVEAGHLDTDPTIRLPRPKVPERPPRPIPEKDLEMALTCATGQLQMWLILGAFMGLRANEVAGIRRENIEEGILDGKRRLFINGIGKGRKPFRLPVPVAVVPYLQSYMTGRTGPIFLTNAGTPLTQGVLTNTVSAFFGRLGMPWTMHNLRHTYGTLIQRETGDMLQTQMLMRHSSLQTTRQYVEPIQGPGIRAMDKLAGKRLQGSRRRPSGEVA